MQLQLSPSAKGIEVLAITAGIGNGWKFPADVLKASVPKWSDVQVFTDHTRNHHSVRDLGGVLCSPEWDDQAQGIKCLLAPSGPAAQVVRDLAEASLSHPSLIVGMSADIIMRVDKHTVLEIVKVRSLDVVMHPARGGKFIRVLQGEIEMNEEEENQYTLSDNSATAARLQAQIAASEKLLADQCMYLLNSALTTSRLPDITQARLRRHFEGHTFEAAQLSAAIEDAYREVSALTGASAVKGPRISGMFDTNDQLQVAVDDLFGAPRDKDKQSLQVCGVMPLPRVERSLPPGR